MRAIHTKYLSSTTHRCSRIKAYDGEGFQVTMSTSEINFKRDEEYHREAAKRLAIKMNWSGRYVGGGTKEGMVWVHVPVVYPIPVDTAVREYLKNNCDFFEVD